MTFLLIAFLLLPVVAFCAHMANQEIDGAVEAVREGEDWLWKL